MVSGKGNMSNKACQYVNPTRKCAINTGSGKDSVTFEAKNGTLIMSAAGGSISIDYFDESWNRKEFHFPSRGKCNHAYLWSRQFRYKL